MRDIIRDLTRFYWDDAFETLVGSTIVLLISLFFANFEQIFRLYNSTATTDPNSHPGISGVFQVILWPAMVSTLVSLITSSIRLVHKIRHRSAAK